MNNFKPGDRVVYNDYFGVMPDYLGFVGTVNSVGRGVVNVEWDNGAEGDGHSIECLSPTDASPQDEQPTTDDSIVDKWANEIKRVVAAGIVGEYTYHGILYKMLSEYDQFMGLGEE